ncbi:DUF1102 domain-containing protein [Thermococcus aggregans]|uniref:DUF1102 domain-containing protein n=1 Tax=Thermococcus aggregans TaxID=110163 RepID=A0A9E7MYQ0_THEAG|nr:DUF1102 domain-containing protein [Thermococcus aggregans]USS41300.1 DUF1102 domain-containing protein [Thermococcus aggregans]
MNKLIGLAILLIGMMLAVGAGATFRYYEADRGITVAIVSDENEFIDLTPAQPYAYLNNGKLTIEISTNNPNYNETLGFGRGLSPNTTYVFEHMFNVSNELWENNETDFPICVQISITQGSGVEIFEGDWAETSGTQLQFTVYHNTPVSVGMVFDTSNMGLSVNPGDIQVQMSIHAWKGTCD